MEQATTLVAYCPHCSEQHEIKQTVPWQADLCITCGGDIEEDTDGT